MKGVVTFRVYVSRKDSKKKNGKDTTTAQGIYTRERIRMTSTRVAKGVSNADFVSVACPEKNNNDDVEIETFFVLIENVLLPSSEEDGKYSRKDVVLDARVGGNRTDDGSFSRERIR